MVEVRNADGWLPPESLRAGMREAYATTRGGLSVTVTLGWAGLGTNREWLVTRLVRTSSGELVAQHHSWFEKLNEARSHFRLEVRRAKP